MRRFTETSFVVGRAEGIGLRFDPSSDLQVSAQHARFERRGDGWWVVDLQSRNGTWVDGDRVAESRVVLGTRVRFGWEGPEVEVVAPEALSAPDLVQGLASRNRALAALVGVLGVAFVAALVWSNRSRAASLEIWQQERAALVARTDSVLQANEAALAALAGELQGLGDALRDSEARVRRLQLDLEAMAASSRPDPASLAELRSQIEAATTRVSNQQRAAALDAAGITATVRPAVVMVYTEFGDGERTVATGFAVSSDGRIVTNRHVVAGASGQKEATRVGVQFSGSSQVWPTDIIAIDDGSDLALLQTRNLVGGNPTIPAIHTRADTLVAGTPLLLLGFPEVETAAETNDTPRALATAGTSLGLRNGRLEVDGWGAAGGSGSPVLDGTGTVVGVLYGAVGDGDTRRLVAVPASRLRAFLAEN